MIGNIAVLQFLIQFIGCTQDICLMFQRLIGKVAKPGFFRAPFFAALNEILEKAVLFVNFIRSSISYSICRLD